MEDSYVNTLLTIWGISGVIIGAFCAYVAKQKNREAMPWFIGGLFFSIIALIAIAGVPVLENKEFVSSKKLEDKIIASEKTLKSDLRNLK